MYKDMYHVLWSLLSIEAGLFRFSLLPLKFDCLFERWTIKSNMKATFWPIALCKVKKYYVTRCTTIGKVTSASCVIALSKHFINEPP